MKATLLLFLCLFIGINSSTAQQRVFTFKINQNLYNANEEQLNDLFGSIFQQLVNRKTTNFDDFNIWKDTFERWKYIAYNGHLSWKTYGAFVSDGRVDGNLSDEDRGIDRNGKTAMENPNKPSHKAARMAIINGLMWISITNTFTEFKVSR